MSCHGNCEEECSILFLNLFAKIETLVLEKKICLNQGCDLLSRLTIFFTLRNDAKPGAPTKSFYHTVADLVTCESDKDIQDVFQRLRAFV